MCIVYNQIGCLTAIKSHLRQHGVGEYKSLNDLIEFQNTYPTTREQIIIDHKLLIEREKDSLSIEIERLNQSIEAKKDIVKQKLLSKLEKLKYRLDSLPTFHGNIIQAFISYIKKIYFKLAIRINTITFNFRVDYSVKHLIQDFNKKKIRHKYILEHYDDAIIGSSLAELQRIDKKKNVIDQINNAIYGAIGEEKVVEELEKLSDEYILINDFTCKFQPAISYKKGNDYIKSIQIDHILIAPSCIFLIETKNWSQHSINNPNLYSPVEQIKRSNFALYMMLNGKTSNSKLTLSKHLWGSKKIPLRNLVVLINHKPLEEFEHVKVLTLNRMLGYVKYFDSYFSNEETKKIACYLLNSIRR